jgi:hypothetical protein
MGVTRRRVGSLGVVAGLAWLAALAASQAGCASSAAERTKPAAASTTSVALPPVEVRAARSPAPYRVPRGALHVSSSASLAAALADGRRETIVLARGTYDNARPFSDREGDRIYASRLGGAVLRAGIVLGANEGAPGALIRGLRFDVRDPAKTLHGAIVHVWGSARNAAVLDTRLDGHGVVDAGLVVREPEGFVGRRIAATAFRSYGVAVDPNDESYRARSPFLLEDLTLSRVRRAVPGSSNGTAEACLWLGSSGTVRRVRARGCGVTGVWTGTATRGASIQDVAVDRTRVGIYIEHYTTGTTFRRLRIGPHVSRGVNAEWANWRLGGKPASVDNVIEDALVETGRVGVYLDQGTTRTVVRRCTFVGQAWAAIGDYRGVGNRYYDNDFTRIAAGAAPVSLEHDTGGRGGGP